MPTLKKKDHICDLNLDDSSSPHLVNDLTKENEL